jgi:hypothetical protein
MDETLAIIEEFCPRAGREPSEWFLSAHNMGLITFAEAESLYLCYAPVLRS